MILLFFNFFCFCSMFKEGIDEILDVVFENVDILLVFGDV